MYRTRYRMYAEHAHGAEPTVGDTMLPCIYLFIYLFIYLSFYLSNSKRRLRRARRSVVWAARRGRQRKAGGDREGQSILRSALCVSLRPAALRRGDGMDVIEFTLVIVIMFARLRVCAQYGRYMRAVRTLYARKANTRSGRLEVRRWEA